MRFAVDDLWIGHRRGPAVLEEICGDLRPVAFGQAAVQQARVPRLRGSVMPGLIDRHVHLGLVDAAALADTAVVEVHDMGWVPEVARSWKINSATGGLVKIAGPFLTAAGGYPSDRAWAPPTSVRELAGPTDGVRAVEEAALHRHDLVKLVLHSGAPLLDDATLLAVVRAALQHRLPVGVHAEGRGQARRAFEAGVDILVHVPWTELLDNELLRAMAHSMRWISTFAIHDDAGRERALDNARRFLGFGGRMEYGTDLGNGPRPPGPWADEISLLGEVGLIGDALLASMTHLSNGRLAVDRAAYAALPLPESATEVAAWTSKARRLTGVLAEAAMT